MKLAELLLIVFVNFARVGALNPVLHFTIIDKLGHLESVMSLLYGGFSLAIFIGNPVLGWYTDRLGRKRVLIASMTLVTAARF